MGDSPAASAKAQIEIASARAELVDLVRLAYSAAVGASDDPARIVGRPGVGETRYSDTAGQGGAARRPATVLGVLAVPLAAAGVTAVPAAAATTYAVTATIGVGIYPAAVGVDPSTHTVYVANAAGNSVSVIDGATNTVTATIFPVGSDPRGVGVDPSTHTVYVTNQAAAPCR